MGPQWTVGKFRSALEFNGTSDFVEVVDHPDLNFGPDDSLTIAAWVKYSSATAGTNSWIVGKAGHLAAHYLFGHHQTASGARLKLDDGGTDLKLDAVFAPDDEWHHFAVVRDKDKGEARIYIDGKVAASGPDGTSDTTNDAPLHIGQRGNGGEFMNGAIDELAIWRIALTDHEIVEVMNDGLAHILAVTHQGKLANRWGSIKRSPGI
jgi:sialidase-1